MFLIASCKKTGEPFDTQYLPDGIKRSEHQYFSSSGSNTDSSRIHPPHWWIGLKMDTIEILIHDDKIKNWYVDFTIPGCQFVQSDTVENPNYKFLKVFIGPKAKSGLFSINLTKGDSLRKYPFSLKELNTQNIDPIRSNDRIYLIMPDRFANGNLENDSYPNLRQKGIDRSKMYFRHGGDLQGIIDHLDYIKDLGFSAIWLNPVLINDQPYTSYHGYACTDHYTVDPRFGGNEMYKKLAETCDAKGIKLIQDVVPNHVGDFHWFVRDLPEDDWIHQFEEYIPCNHSTLSVFDPYSTEKEKDDFLKGWFDNSMPDLNQKNPKLAQYFIQNTIWWILEMGLDAIRVDTYHYSYPEFLASWIKAIKTDFPDFYIFGEVWMPSVALQSEFLKPGKFNAGPPLAGITDFQLNYKILDLLKEKISAPDFMNFLSEDVYYPKDALNAAFLDNHDMDRFYSAIEENDEKFLSGLSILYALNRVPIIYYGTEIMDKNFKAPDGLVRSDFPGGWPNDPINKFEFPNLTDSEKKVWLHIQALNNLRANLPCLSEGKLVKIQNDHGLLFFQRTYNENSIFFVFNPMNNDVQFNLSEYAEVNTTKFLNLLDNDEIENERFELKPYQSVFIQPLDP